MLVSPIQICVCAPATLFAKKGLVVISLPLTAVMRQAKITPLHAGHVGLLCTAGLLNGVFGDRAARVGPVGRRLQRDKTPEHAIDIDVVLRVSKNRDG
jgi:hypothetical protein